MRISFTAVIGLVFTAIAVMSLSLSPAARLLPLMVSIPGMLLSMIALLREIRVPAVADDGEEQGSMTELKAAGWIFAFWAAVLLFGFLIGAPLVTAAYLFLALRRSAVASIVAGLVCFAGTYGLFERLLDVPLFHGLLTPVFASLLG